MVSVGCWRLFDRCLKCLQDAEVMSRGCLKGKSANVRFQLVKLGQARIC